MKRLAFFFACIATLALTSCSMLSSASTSNAVAQATGQTCGTAVLGLYNSYHSTGRLDLTNATNLTNALTLATCYTQLNENKGNSEYRKAFATGMVISSAGLITTANATAFIDKLLGTTALNGLTVEKVSQTASTAMAIVALLNALKQ